jgi:ribosomal protein S18 acetylase RimI-like enzyme
LGKTGQPIVRNVNPGDRVVLADLIRATSLVHRHMDWRPPLEWLKFEPFLVYEVDGKIQACLACPVHPQPVAWLRLFLAYSPRVVEAAWQALWPVVQDELLTRGAVKAAALPIDAWLSKLLEKQGFQQTNRVVSLMWKAQQEPQGWDAPGCIVRPALPDDLPQIAAVDAAAFEDLWRQPLEDLELAYEQCAVATVAEAGNRIVGYQISTGSTMGGHLARLAVHPQVQQRGIGKAMVADLQKRFLKRGARWLTVNTQNDNLTSLALYQKAGFRLTGENYPVYERTIAGKPEIQG